jgi:hypothetical protein
MIAPFEQENEAGLHPHQPSGAGGAIEIGVDQLLKLKGLEADVAPDAGDALLEPRQVSVREPAIEFLIAVFAHRRTP